MPTAPLERTTPNRVAVKGHEVQDGFIEKLVGRPIIVVFVDGKQLTGDLLAHDTYTLQLRVTRDSGTLDILAYKHGVKYVATTGG